MTYVIGDLHGCQEEWNTMLKQIDFSDSDQMYILGDVLDRGAAPIALLQQIMERPNVTCVMGNHEWMFSHIFAPLLQDPSAPQLSGKRLFAYLAFDHWTQHEGEATSREFLALPRRAQTQILEYIDNMPFFLETTVGGKAYVLTHAGINGFSRDKPLSEYRPQEFLDFRPKPTTEFYPDKTLLIGHTPTMTISETHRGKIYRTDSWIDLDCGAVFCEKGGRLACLRLEDDTEFYCTRNNT